MFELICLVDRCYIPTLYIYIIIFQIPFFINYGFSILSLFLVMFIYSPCLVPFFFITNGLFCFCGCCVGLI